MARAIDNGDLIKAADALDNEERHSLAEALRKDAEDTYGIMMTLIRTDKVVTLTTRLEMVALAKSRRDKWNNLADVLDSE